MIWTAVIKGSALVTFVQGAMALVDKVFGEELNNRFSDQIEELSSNQLISMINGRSGYILFLTLPP